MHAEQERVGRRGHAPDFVRGVLAEQVRHVTHFVDAHVAIPQIRFRVRRATQRVSEVVGAAAANAPEVLVAVLERAVLVEGAEVPFADQRGLVTGRAQLCRQRGLAGVEPDIVCAQAALPGRSATGSGIGP